MIGIDTNILVRLITGDDKKQLKLIDDLIENHCGVGEIFVADTVLVELEWVLSSGYEFSRQEIHGALKQIVRTSQFAFRNQESLVRAISSYEKTSRDFSDCLIGEQGREFGVTTYTFDRQLHGNPNFVVLK